MNKYSGPLVLLVLVGGTVGAMEKVAVETELHPSVLADVNAQIYQIIDFKPVKTLDEVARENEFLIGKIDWLLKTVKDIMLFLNISSQLEGRLEYVYDSFSQDIDSEKLLAVFDNARILFSFNKMRMTLFKKYFRFLEKLTAQRTLIDKKALMKALYLQNTLTGLSMHVLINPSLELESSEKLLFTILTDLQ